MKADEIRERFLSFFESKGCRRHPSSSLVPDDPTLLTTSAGMVQFKPYFLGLKKPPHTRLTTSQKCLRAVDIGEVGRTPRHHTFFEMLGNFSFGDYFKHEAITWAWELLTEGFGIPADRLKISVYKDDEDAAKIWLGEVGIQKDRLYYLGEKDNYWPSSCPSKGPDGPCGPCSEIFYDFGEERGCGKPGCDVTCDCGRYIELWNLVFMQYERHDGGRLTPLPMQNIDTGSGLERVASVLQGTPTNFETDLLFPIIQKIESIASVPYKDNLMPMRVIADHIRGCTFLVADGVFPSNEGRGYLLRKVLRRACTYGREIGIEKPFLYTLAEVVNDILGHQYSELIEKRELVENIIHKEEEQFADALAQGRMFVMNHKKEMAGGEEPPAGLADGAIVFTAYDTYGLPVEETEKIVKELGFDGVDVASFKKAMDEQKERSRRGSKMDGSVFVEDLEKVYRDAASDAAGVFDGYESMEMETKVVSLIKDGASIEEAEAGSEVDVITLKSPFYGEMGGQVGDMGEAQFDGGRLDVTDTFMADGNIVVHRSKIIEGTLKTGASITLKVLAGRREAIMRHHTATHLLHAALRSVLGSHVAQSGSYVGPDKLRFDFTHHKAVTPEELKKVEGLVNRKVLEGLPVETSEKSFEEAKKEGAIALFGEKYGDVVRRVKAGDFSMELCGGTHVANTAQVGIVKITEERSIGSSLRRIEAVAGEVALDYIDKKLDVIKQAAELLNAQEIDLLKSIESLKSERDRLKKAAKKAGRGQLKDAGRGLLDAAEVVDGVTVVAASVEGIDAKSLRNLYDELKVKLDSYVVLLGSNPGGKVALLLAFSDDVVARGLNAGKMIKDIAKHAGGGGGGSPKLGQAGGRDGSKIAGAVAEGAELLKEKLRA